MGLSNIARIIWSSESGLQFSSHCSMSVRWFSVDIRSHDQKALCHPLNASRKISSNACIDMLSSTIRTQVQRGIDTIMEPFDIDSPTRRAHHQLRMGLYMPDMMAQVRYVHGSCLMINPVISSTRFRLEPLSNSVPYHNTNIPQLPSAGTIYGTRPNSAATSKKTSSPHCRAKTLRQIESKLSNYMALIFFL